MLTVLHCEIVPARRGSRPASALTDLRSLYHKHFGDLRKERQLWSTSNFFFTFALVRAITYSIRARRGPFRDITVGGRHIHHLTFGIFGVIGIGYLWMLEIGTGMTRRRASRLTSGFYGAGTALTLDEFALWFNLQDCYWTREGRKSIDAVALFGSLLILNMLGKDMVAELVETARADPATRTRVRRRRYLRHHPCSPIPTALRRWIPPASRLMTQG